MKAVILVGGKATRLEPLTLNTPKAMMPVLNTPFLEHVIRHLTGHIMVDRNCWPTWLIPVVRNPAIQTAEGFGNLVEVSFRTEKGYRHRTDVFYLNVD